MHGVSYLLKLQIDHVILDWHGQALILDWPGQACTGMPKEAFETNLSQKMLEFQS